MTTETTVLQDRFELTRVHILESIVEGCLHNGRQLFTALATDDALSDAAVYHEVFDLNDLMETLDSIASDLRDHGSVPLIHIEAHGSHTGLQLASGDLVPWPIFLEAVRAINRASRFNTLLYLAACQTEWILASIRTLEPAPFAGCMLYHGDVRAGEIADNLAPFYTSLFTGCNIQQALAAAATAAGTKEDTSRLQFWSAQYFFVRAFAEYIRRRGDNTSLLHRAADVAAAAGHSMELDTIFRIKSDILANHKELFMKHRAAFFLYDLIPANRERFQTPFHLVELLLSDHQTDGGDSR